MLIPATDPSGLEQQMKLFLTEARHVDTTQNINTKCKSILERKVNYLMMLNLPSEIKQFGPWWYLWEFGGMGERLLSRIKSVVHSMHRTVSECTILHNMSSVHYMDIL